MLLWRHHTIQPNEGQKEILLVCSYLNNAGTKSCFLLVTALWQFSFLVQTHPSESTNSTPCKHGNNLDSISTVRSMLESNRPVKRQPIQVLQNEMLHTSLLVSRAKRAFCEQLHASHYHRQLLKSQSERPHMLSIAFKAKTSLYKVPGVSLPGWKFVLNATLRSKELVLLKVKEIGVFFHLIQENNSSFHELIACTEDRSK